MSGTYGYIRTDAGTLATCRVQRHGGLTLTRIADAFVALGAGLLVALAALIVTVPMGATPAHPSVHSTTTASQVVVCDAFLSHGAMVAAAETNIQPAPSFCVVAGN